MANDVELAKAYFDQLADLVCAGGAAAADECFGMQLALPAGSPDILYEGLYGTAVTTLADQVRVITKRRQVDSQGLDDYLTSLAMDAFDRRWNDLSARLGAGGEA